ncbi:MAG TPA: patatin-like phospholipase family protein [Bryobacteraceae bacterium]|nr:patatin-like phospholipase family protein [Bryobacteraceae bacterium]
MRSWVEGIRHWARAGGRPSEPVIGLALGGGFARGIAHLGVLRVFEQHRIPLGRIAGVSAGAIVAAAYASGASVEEIADAARGMRFKDVARWGISLLGLAGSERMAEFLQRLLKVYRFEEMRIPLAVVATDLKTGRPVVFRDRGDVLLPIRASCSYPGLFRPVRCEGQHLVDGAMTMEVPAVAVRGLGATKVVSVVLPMNGEFDPRNMLQVVNRCFQIMQRRSEQEWRRASSVVIEPDVNGMTWDGFESAERLIERGEKAARAALPRILSWMERGAGAGETARTAKTLLAADERR